MMRTAVIGLALIGALVLPRAAAAQAVDILTEADLTVGGSTEDVRAAGTQLRLFGMLPGNWRFYTEATWADTWGKASADSDAFGAAYPYDRRLRPMELYVEKTTTTARSLWGARLGVYRTPFGLYARSEHAYTGFLRAPLMRYGGYWGVSNNFLETGASVVAGSPRLFGEFSLGAPHDQDDLHRARGFDRVGRVQLAVGDIIVGASYIHTQPFREQALFAHGDSEFAGVDARWMRGGIQVRGEWINGHAFAGTKTVGGYADLLVHRQFMGPVTAVLRAERLDYEAGVFSSFPRRYTAGAKVRVSSRVIGQVNVLREPPYGNKGAETALDAAVTLSFRR